jgi:TetR/AcrR family transcriptional regulator, transcriptional repressor for nem operon
MTNSDLTRRTGTRAAATPGERAAAAPGTGLGSGPGKRERLVAAAAQMLHQQGVEATTLADIARAAGIPLGNVYYYFKAKSDIITAVIEAHAGAVASMLGGIEAGQADPAARLKALFAALAGENEMVARYGCPHGTLCQELAKHADGAGGPDASLLVRIPIDWAERQFAAMGRADARDLAIQVIAAYQGAALLTSALRDQAVLERESRRMAAWIDSLR